MKIMLRDLVDFDELSRKLGSFESHKSRDVVEKAVVSDARELSLNESLRGVDYSEYIKGASNVEMVGELYKRIVPVHQIERGVVAPVYFVNKPFMGKGEFCLRVDGLYSSDIITYWSCAGHLPGEPQTGRDTGKIKPPCMFFFCGRDLEGRSREEYERMLNRFRQGDYDIAEMGGFGVGICGKISSDDENESIEQMKGFWRDFLGDLNKYYGREIFSMRLVEAIRPSTRIV